MKSITLSTAVNFSKKTTLITIFIVVHFTFVNLSHSDTGAISGIMTSAYDLLANRNLTPYDIYAKYITIEKYYSRGVPHYTVRQPFTQINNISITNELKNNFSFSKRQLAGFAQHKNIYLELIRNKNNIFLSSYSTNYTQLNKDIGQHFNYDRLSPATFKGYLAEWSEAEARGIYLTKNKRAMKYDLFDPINKKLFQVKIYRSARDSYKSLLDDFNSINRPWLEKYYSGIMPANQVDQLINQGFLTAAGKTKFKDAAGRIYYEQSYTAPDKKFSIYKTKSFSTPEQFSENVRKGIEFDKHIKKTSPQKFSYAKSGAYSFLTGSLVVSGVDFYLNKSFNINNTLKGGSTATGFALGTKLLDRGLYRYTTLGKYSGIGALSLATIATIGYEYYSGSINTKQAALQTGIVAGSVGVQLLAESLIAMSAEYGSFAGPVGTVAGLVTGVALAVAYTNYEKQKQEQRYDIYKNFAEIDAIRRRDGDNDNLVKLKREASFEISEGWGKILNN